MAYHFTVVRRLVCSVRQRTNIDTRSSYTTTLSRNSTSFLGAEKHQLQDLTSMATYNNWGSIRSMFLSSQNSKFKHMSIRAAVSTEQYYIWMPQLLLFCAFTAKNARCNYCFQLAEGNLPTLDILSPCHETAWLLVTLQHVIKDFSYALMQACINAFDNWMQIVAYLQTTYRVMCHQCTKKQHCKLTRDRCLHPCVFDDRKPSCMKDILSTHHSPHQLEWLSVLSWTVGNRKLVDCFDDILLCQATLLFICLLTCHSY